MRALGSLTAAAFLAACSGPKTLPPLPLASGCNPLMGGGECFLPYPSDFFRVADPSLPSGFRIDPQGAASLKTPKGLNANIGTWRKIDGFSRIPPILFSFPAAMAPDGFVGLFNPPEESQSPSSNTVLIEAGSGALIPHFVDLDPRATDPTKQAVVIHPIVGLRPLTRYVVAVHGVKQADGSPVSAPEGFRRIRDIEYDGDPVLAPLADHYQKEIFPVLAAAGVDVRDVQLAWDFTTESDEWVMTDMLDVRSQTLAWLGQNTPQVTITSVVENPSSDIWRTVAGTVTGPLFLDSANPGAKLFRDANGKVTQNGTTPFNFMAQVPASLIDQFGPGRPLAYGHGFFGSMNELTSNGARTIANRTRSVTFSTDWWGMSSADLSTVIDSLAAHPFDVVAFSDRVHQAMANWLVLTAAMEGPLRDQDAFKRPASGVGTSTLGGQSNAGLPLYDPPASYFIGISEGHILGGTLAALNPRFDRVVLQVGGAGLTHLMFRASPFSGFLYVLDTTFNDPFAEQKFLATTQAQFDRVDPGFWATYVLQNKLPGSPADRQVLMQTGLGDTEVPNLGSFLHARLLGLSELQPAPVTVFGVPGVTAPFQGSAQTLFDFGVDLKAVYAVAEPQSAGTFVHEGLRLLDASLEQIDAFWHPNGPIIQPCGGQPCRVGFDTSAPPAPPTVHGATSVPPGTSPPARPPF